MLTGFVLFFTAFCMFGCIMTALLGLVFALFSAQPIVILLTTAPIAIYITIIRDLAVPLGTDLMTLYTLTGLFNVMFLVLYALFNLSKLMKFSTRSVEEIFGIFITCAFSKDAIKHITTAFHEHYYNYDVNEINNMTSLELNSYEYLSQKLQYLFSVIFYFFLNFSCW